MMRRSAFALALVVMIFTLSLSCGGRGSRPKGSAQPSLISRADIERVRARSALDAVQRFRADVLMRRAPSSINLDKRLYPVVFLNEQFYGPIDELRNFPADGIEEIHILTGPNAQTKFGSQYGGGVIQIISRIG
jgi:outer membrane cobalamin receptor